MFPGCSAPLLFPWKVDPPEMDVAVGRYKVTFMWDCGCEMEMDSTMLTPDSPGGSMLEFLSACVAHAHSESLRLDSSGADRGHLCDMEGEPRPPARVLVELIPPTEHDKRVAAAPWN